MNESSITQIHRLVCLLVKLGIIDSNMNSKWSMEVNSEGYNLYLNLANKILLGDRIQ